MSADSHQPGAERKTVDATLSPTQEIAAAFVFPVFPLPKISRWPFPGFGEA